MKIIITEDQHKMLLETTNIELAKKLCFKLWKSQEDSGKTPVLDLTVLKYMNVLDWWDVDMVYEWFTEFMGGWDRMKMETIELLRKTYDTNNYDFRGGYDFRFTTIDKIKEDSMSNEIRVGCKVYSDGKVDLIMTDSGVHFLKDLEDREFWWEIDIEMRELVESVYYEEITLKTGIKIQVSLIYVEA